MQRAQEVAGLPAELQHLNLMRQQNYCEDYLRLCNGRPPVFAELLTGRRGKGGVRLSGNVITASASDWCGSR